MAGGEKVWDSQADWQTWTQMDGNCEITVDGSVKVASGHTYTNLRCLYEAVGATPLDIGGGTLLPAFTDLILEGVHETCTAYCFRVRTGATAVACQAATWSDWQDGYDDTGTISLNLFNLLLNDPALNSGPWIEIDLLLKTD